MELVCGCLSLANVAIEKDWGKCGLTHEIIIYN